MARAKGVQRNPIFKLGKAAARRDVRNLRLRAVLKVLAKLPAEWDFDVRHKGVPTPMFGNDRFGDCVIAGRAHQTLRFERLEQKRILRITEQEVLAEYFRQTGGEDTGLTVLDSLRQWRKRGWIAAKDRYYIQAFAEIDRTSETEVKRAIFMELGVGIGLSLPRTAEAEFEAGKPWVQTSGKGSRPNTWGGHYVYVTGYTKLGPTCVTWGRKQPMSWAFFKKYCDEAYAIIDQFNTPKKKKGLDALGLSRFLATVSAPARRGASRKRSAALRTSR